MNYRAWIGCTLVSMAGLCAHGAPGSFDSNFAGGKVVTSFPPETSSTADAVAMTPNGRVLVGGTSSREGSYFVAFARYTPQGELDSAFGNGGRLVTSLYGFVEGMAVASDGAIVVVTSGCRVTRFTPEGAVDMTFGTGGQVAAPCHSAGGLVLDSAGRIVIAGAHSDSTANYIVVIRLTPNGTLDSSFNSSGSTEVIPAISGKSVGADGVAMSPSGKIVMLGHVSTSLPFANAILVARYNADGTADSTFGTDGRVITNVSEAQIPFGPRDYGNAIAVDASERVAVVGTAAGGNAVPTKLLVIRFAPNGTLDLTFNGSGYSAASSFGSDSGNGVAIQEDGKIIAVGQRHTDIGGIGSFDEFLVARYLANGTRDPAFGADGIVSAGFQGGEGRAVALGTLELGGEIVAVGRGANAFAVAALNGDNPPRMYGVSTRMQVLMGDDVMIGGFIVDGTQPKTVMVRARGPSLGIAGALADPVLTLVPAAGGPAVVNDDWQADANAATLAAIGYEPSNAKESALLRTLPPGGYTAIVTGAGGMTGIGIVEIYEVDRPETPLIGISTRGRVQTGDNVMIGGFLIKGDGPRTVVVRARGPSLSVPGALSDPVLTLVPVATGVPLVNDDWQSDSAAAALSSSGFAPDHPKESALMRTLAPGAYTAIVTGAGNTSGVAIVEVYRINP